MPAKALRMESRQPLRGCRSTFGALLARLVETLSPFTRKLMSRCSLVTRAYPFVRRNLLSLSSSELIKEQKGVALPHPRLLHCTPSALSPPPPVPHRTSSRCSSASRRCCLKAGDKALACPDFCAQVLGWTAKLCLCRRCRIGFAQQHLSRQPMPVVTRYKPGQHCHVLQCLGTCRQCSKCDSAGSTRECASQSLV